jgi:hypothetical protein
LWEIRARFPRGAGTKPCILLWPGSERHNHNTPTRTASQAPAWNAPSAIRLALKTDIRPGGQQVMPTQQLVQDDAVHKRSKANTKKQSRA